MERLILVLILLLATSCEQPVSEKEPYKTIMVKADGRDDVVPDMAKFEINLECLKYTPAASRNCLVEKSNELKDKLLSFKIDENDMITTAVDMQKQYTWNKNSRIFQGYRASASLVVTVRNLEDMDKIYTDLIDDENTNLHGLYYEHSKMDSLRNRVYLKALDNANNLAESLLQQLPEEDYEVLQIGNTKIQPSGTGRLNGMQADAVSEEVEMQGVNQRAISISKGTIPIEVYLYVEYLIK